MPGTVDLPISGLVRSWPDVTREECAGYHVIDLPGGETIQGQWDLRGRMPEYIGNVDVRGKRVLDIGAASGFLSFEMERLGAREVVSFDADDHRRIANIPVWNSEYVKNRAKWKHDVDVFLTMLKNGYWYNHKRLQSKAACLYGDVYDIKVPDQAFDIVVLGQILVHLRDPITAMAEAARVAKETLVIAEGVYESTETVGMLHARAAKGGPPYIWWQLSVPAYQELLAMFGFEVSRVHKAKYRCVQHEHASGDMEIATIVAKRRV